MVASNVVLQDVVYAPVGRDVESEYGIIANLGPEPVDLTGWTLRDILQHQRRAPYTFRFPSFVLAAGAMVHVHTGSGINAADDLYWGRRQAVWHDTGDTAVLSDERGYETSRFAVPAPEIPIQLLPGTVAISDLHIGDNSRTCWYQKSIHEPYLCTLMDWIIAHVKAKDLPIDRLIFLGDLFDFWTYSPDQHPPTIEQILAANPNIFGPDGKIRMDALKGNVLYLSGNHDINTPRLLLTFALMENPEETRFGILPCALISSAPNGASAEPAMLNSFQVAYLLPGWVTVRNSTAPNQASRRCRSKSAVVRPG